MGIKKKAKQVGAVRLPALRVDRGETRRIFLDVGQEPRWLALHDRGAAGKVRCQLNEGQVHDEDGASCKFCSAELPRRVSWLITVDEVNGDGDCQARTFWLDTRELGRLAMVLPGDSGSAVIDVSRVDDDEATAEMRKAGRDTRSGRPLTMLVFKLDEHGSDVEGQE